ncbi:maestro heat-like repeat-containing protein family member 7 [Pseudopipra pipra]|uniref:maestro heat-like repeat-containing protein family member 7 n=1 Tax=Pseudopipra pipra TaxID=415032 RepID=UPI003139375A
MPAKHGHRPAAADPGSPGLSVWTFMKFMGSRRRKARITPADVQAQPDTIPTQLTNPDVSTASTAAPAKCDTATTDHTTHWDTTSTDDVSHCDSVLPGLTEEADATTMEGVASTDAAPVQRLADTPSLEFLEERAVSAELVCRFIRCIWHEEATFMVTGDTANSDLFNAQTSAALLDLLVENGVYKAKQGTVALWEIIQLSHSWCPSALKDNFPRLLLTLLFQVFISTEEMSEEVETFWRRCREQRSLPPNPNRFAVQTVKALLCQLLDEDVLMAIGRKSGWDMLLKADSHHYAVGLLARELCHVSRSFCRSIAISLLPRLSRGEPLWELPALAFLVEVLHCLNPRQFGPSVLQIISRHLRSQCPERRRLALRGLVVLSKAPSMAKSIRSLNESLLELLQDADTDAVEMTLTVFINVLGLKIIQISSPIALKLLEVLRPLFDNEHSQLQQLSMLLFQELMEATERSRSLKPHVYLSLR